MKILNKNQSGFTLVELVVVVAVIGVLAVIAAPKIVGVATDARTASLAAVTSNMTAAMARNYAAREANSSDGQDIDKCSAVTKLMISSVMPAGYAFVSNDGDVSMGNADQVECRLSTTNNPPLTDIFYGIGTSPN
jgi:prepilin-type N-terminal cleavage/methylation domain-containing protein